MSEPEHEHEQDAEPAITEEDAAETPDLDEGEAELEHEPTGEPEPEAAGVTPEEMEKKFKSAEKAFKTYTGRITAIFEEQANELVECPLCAGTVPGFVLIGAAGHVDDVTAGAVKSYLGVVQEADYPQDGEYRTCGRCEGLGQVRTGSRVPNWITLPCPTCLGHGYLGPPSLTANGAGEPAQALVAAGVPGQPAAAEDADPLGSPRLLPDGMENPNYGKFPQFKDPRFP